MMPNENEVKSEYGRLYRFIKPYSTEPGTWRLSLPEKSESVGGGIVDVDGINPIKTNQTPTKVTVSLDIQSLDTLP